jgi:hypothetical protein
MMKNSFVTIEGVLKPARKKLNQYELQCLDVNSINSNLPLTPGNPYVVTVSRIVGRRNKGIPVTCEFNNNPPVIGQFHRGRRIWIGTNKTIAGISATNAWHQFMLLFKITVGLTDTEIPVYLDFYSNLQVVIRLRAQNVTRPPQILKK